MTGTDLATSDASARGWRRSTRTPLADVHPEIELQTPPGIVRGATGLRALLAPPTLEYLERTVIGDDIIDAGERAVALGWIQLPWRDADEPTDTNTSAPCSSCAKGASSAPGYFPTPTRQSPPRQTHARTRTPESERGTQPRRARPHARAHRQPRPHGNDAHAGHPSDDSSGPRAERRRTSRGEASLAPYARDPGGEDNNRSTREGSARR